MKSQAGWIGQLTESLFGSGGLARTCWHLIESLCAPTVDPKALRERANEQGFKWREAATSFLVTPGLTGRQGALGACCAVAGYPRPRPDGRRGVGDSFRGTPTDGRVATIVGVWESLEVAQRLGSQY